MPVCPEVEAGLGTPREAMRLVGSANAPRLVTIKTQRDLTRPLKSFSARKIKELQALDLSGYVFKARSPSCGVDRVPLYDRYGRMGPNGMGLFARSFQKRFPLIPMTDEGRLADPACREYFLKQVFGYHRWSMLAKRSATHRAVVDFHRAQADLLLSCSRTRHHALNQLIAQAARYRPKELVARYGREFMKALRSRTRSRETPRTKKMWAQ